MRLLTGSKKNIWPPNVLTPKGHGGNRGGLSFEDRLHVDPMTEDEISAALAEKLPEGWTGVRCSDEMSVYYWNEKTDGTTWLKPVAPADTNIPHAREVFASSRLHDEVFRSSKVLFGENTAAGGATTIQWPPLPDRQPGRPEVSLRGAGKEVGTKAILANVLRTRVGDIAGPPPKPLTTKERILQYHRDNDPDFDEDQWTFNQGKWVHLKSKKREEKEIIRLRKAGERSYGTPTLLDSAGGAFPAAAEDEERAALVAAERDPERPLARSLPRPLLKTTKTMRDVLGDKLGTRLSLRDALNLISISIILFVVLPSFFYAGGIGPPAPPMPPAPPPSPSRRRRRRRRRRLCRCHRRRSRHRRRRHGRRRHRPCPCRRCRCRRPLLTPDLRCHYHLRLPGHLHRGHLRRRLRSLHRLSLRHLALALASSAACHARLDLSARLRQRRPRKLDIFRDWRRARIDCRMALERGGL